MSWALVVVLNQPHVQGKEILGIPPGWISFQPYQGQGNCLPFVNIAFLPHMWDWHGGMVDPATFMGEGARNKQGLCSCSWELIGVFFVCCNPAWWWVHNIVRLPNCVNTCRTVVRCLVGAVHSLLPHILPLSCQQKGWRKLVVCRVSTKKGLSRFGGIRVFKVFSQVVTGQWSWPVVGRTFPSGSHRRHIHPVLQGLWVCSAWWHCQACWQLVVKCIHNGPWGC